jgi:hypothetical protein
MTVHCRRREDRGCANARRVRGAGHTLLRLCGRLLPALALAAALLGWPACAWAQQVRLAGQGDPGIDRRLQRLLAEPDLLIVAADTLIAAGDTVRGPLLVLDARLILEGHVDGDLAGVAADLFLRPRASIAGDLANVGGGLYPSELAQVAGHTLDLPLARYRVERHEHELVIIGEIDFARLRLDGLFGLHAPTYDRVNGLRLTWGAGYYLGPRGAAGPVLHGQVGYLSQRGELEGGVDLSHRLGTVRVEAGVYRLTRTNEEWIRSALINSLHYLWNARDFRDYYAADAAYVELRHEPRRDRLVVEPGLRIEVEEARSLVAGHPWSLLRRGQPPRPNRPADEIRLASATAHADLAWRGRSAAADLRAELEAAGRLLGGERNFGRFLLSGDFGMAALADHRLDFGWHAQTPLWGGLLPRQRWSFVGGFDNLQTVPLGAFHGESVVYLETVYWIPLPDRLRLPYLGVPELGLLHGAGMAWTRDEPRDLVQNIGAGLQASIFFLRFLTDPATGDRHADIGVVWPFGRGPRW